MKIQLNGSIPRLLQNGYAGITIDTMQNPLLPGEVLKDWTGFRGMERWIKEYYVFDSSFSEKIPTPGSPGYFTDEQSPDGYEYLYFNEHFIPRLISNEIDYSENAGFFENLAELRNRFYNAALEIARAIDFQLTPIGISYEDVVTKRRKAACLRLSSSTSEAYKMRDPLRLKEFFLALQLYKSRDQFKLISYFGKHAEAQSNGVFGNRNAEFVLNGSDEILPICALF